VQETVGLLAMIMNRMLPWFTGLSTVQYATANSETIQYCTVLNRTDTYRYRYSIGISELKSVLATKSHGSKNLSVYYYWVACPIVQTGHRISKFSFIFFGTTVLYVELSTAPKIQ